MAQPETIRAEAVIQRLLPRSRCVLELANGHRLIAGRRRSDAGPELAVGQTVRVQISPCDFSQGRLLQQERT
jgi:translation initiation factor IF-1